MKKNLLIAGIVLIVLCLVGIGGFAYISYKKPVQATSVAQKATVEDCSVTDTGVTEAINRYRAEVGVAPLTFNEHLDNFANHRALEQNGRLDSHLGLVGAADKLGYAVVGEDQNVIVWCADSLTRVDRFKSSEKHWTSLMNPRYDEIGAGFYKGILVIDLGDK